MMVLLPCQVQEVEWLSNLMMKKIEQCFFTAMATWQLASQSKIRKLLKDALELTFEVSKLIKYSPKRNVI